VKVFVTGATGFTGGHLARRLVSAGHQVTALVRPRSAERAAAADLRSLGARVEVGDLADGPAVARAVAGAEVAYHIAATYREPGLPDSAYRVVNVDGTRHVLEAARAAGVRRVVHCSTGGVHGHVAHPPANEDSPFRPGDIYQDTKLEAEQLARRFGHEHGLEVVVARPIGIYGPGDRRFLKMFRGLARGRFPMLGRGEVLYHLTYIDDLIDGLRLCGDVPGAAGRTYLLAGPRYTTLAELVALVASELGTRPPRVRFPIWPVWVLGLLTELACVPLRVEPPIYRRRVDFYRKSRAFDTARARRELGFAPHVDLEEGIHRTAEWYRAHAWL